MALEPDNAHALCELAAACHALGDSDEAVALALRAGALTRGGTPGDTPGDRSIAIHAAELLMHSGWTDEAAELLHGVAIAAGAALAAGAANPADPRLFRVLSAAEMMRGRLEAALEAVDRAIAGASDVAEYHIHRGHLLWRLGDLSGAALALDRAAALDPASRDLKRAQMSLYLAAGLVSEATAVGGELLHRFPDDQVSAAAVLHLLTHRLDTIDGEYVVLNDGAGRASRSQRLPPGKPPGWRARAASAA